MTVGSKQISPEQNNLRTYLVNLPPMKRNRRILLSILTAAAILTAADLLCGSAGADIAVMKMLRIPRILTAILAGGALAMSGA